MLASIAMGGRMKQGAARRQAVDNHVEETSHGRTEEEREDD
jgi:hypothetical protein